MIQDYYKNRKEMIELRKYRKVLTVVIVLIVALLMFASFFGVYKTNENGERKNLIPDFKLGMELNKKRVITAEIDKTVNKTIKDAEGNVVQEEEGVEYTEENGYTVEETPVNNSSVKTLENYKKAKKIIEERLSKKGITEYFVSLDELTGKIKIEIPEDDKADEIEAFISGYSNFVLLDGETFESVFDQSYLKSADVVYRQSDIETAVCLQLSFNDEGKEKLRELSNIYVEKTEEQENENGEMEKVTNSKQVFVILNGYPIGQTILTNIVYDDSILLTFGMTNDTTELQNAIKAAQEEAILLNTGASPVIYSYSNEVVTTEMTEKNAFVFGLAIGIIFILAYVYLVFKYKARGFIAVYFQVGFLAILLLIIRLTNVTLTMEGMAGIIISMVLEFVFEYIVLRNMKNEETEMYKKSNLEFFLNTLPLYVIAIIFTFAKRTHVSSFGMTLFWGIVLIYVYNFVFTKFIFENLGMEVNKNENN